MERKKKKLIYNVVVSLLLIAGLVWVCSHFVHLGSVAYTDNAQVKQLIVPVNSRVQGFIKKIYFDEYQEVRKGDTLALIEDSEFRFRLAQERMQWPPRYIPLRIILPYPMQVYRKLKFAWTMPSVNTTDIKTFWHRMLSPNNSTMLCRQITKHPRHVMNFCFVSANLQL